MTRAHGRRLALLGLLFATTMLVWCEKPAAPPPPSTAQLHIEAVVSSPTIVRLEGTVTAPDMPSPGLTFHLDVVNGTASGTVNIPAGSDRLVSIAAYDAAQLKTHTGSKTVTVQPGSNPAVVITLVPLTGQPAIAVTFSSYVVTVSPSPTSVAVGATRTLTVVVADVNGAVVTLSPGDVKWATADPRVAAVNSSGVVMGVGAGTATVMATYRGVGGSVAVTVP